MVINGITGTCEAGHRRCTGKHKFRDGKKALGEAERASRATGELVTAYDCVDCKRWHVGHADESQKLARDPALLAVLPRIAYPDATFRSTLVAAPGAARLSHLREIEAGAGRAASLLQRELLAIVR